MVGGDRQGARCVTNKKGSVSWTETQQGSRTRSAPGAMEAILVFYGVVREGLREKGHLNKDKEGKEPAE